MHWISQRAFPRSNVVHEIKYSPLFCHLSRPALTEHITEDRPPPAPEPQLSPNRLPDDGGSGGRPATVPAAATAATVAASTPHLVPRSPVTADASSSEQLAAIGGEKIGSATRGLRRGSRRPRNGALLRRPRPGAPGSRCQRRRKSRYNTHCVKAGGFGIDTATSVLHDAVAVDGGCQDSSSAPRLTAQSSVCDGDVLVGCYGEHRRAADFEAPDHLAIRPRREAVRSLSPDPGWCRQTEPWRGSKTAM